jgi:hypothetical protein
MLDVVKEPFLILSQNDANIMLELQTSFFFKKKMNDMIIVQTSQWSPKHQQKLIMI